MLKIVILAVSVALASASLETDWINYKEKHNKVYHGKEEVLRFSNYQANRKKIQEHNELYAQGEYTFTLGETQFADWTVEEFNEKMNGLRVTVQPDTAYEEERISNIPKSVDWRKEGYVTPIKNQGQCGSCYAFSAVGAMEGQHFNATGELVSLSESNIVDCSYAYGNKGCEGGFMDNCYKWVIANKGIETEANYPYYPWRNKCYYKKPAGATFSSFVDIKQGSEAGLQDAIANVGPISVAIDASQSTFMLYVDGVYNDPNCTPTKLNHGVLAVGYNATEDEGREYYTVKNSWGTNWGRNGYIWMSRNKKNQCGIATAASYPIV